MRSTKALLLTLALAFSAGCEFLVTFETVPENTTSTGGAGGGTTTGGTTTGGTTTTGGGGGTGGCDVGSCPAPSSECKVAACEMDACVEKDVAEGMDAATQVDGDCKKNVCQGGTVISLNDDADLEDDGKGCTDDLCEGGTAVHAAVAQGTTCADSGGTVCDGAGDCVECNLDFDCTDPLKTICGPTHVCVQPHCTDGSKNFDEADTDCGGNDCGKCPNTFDCNSFKDCQSGYCDPSQKCAACVSDAQCGAAAYCNNGVCDPDKATGQTCTTNSQCQTDHCVDGFCCGVAACGTCQSCGMPGSEGVCADVPIGSMDDTCLDVQHSCDGAGNCKLTNGLPCAGGFECLSGQCVDGVCCQNACPGTCKACNLPGSLGLCANIPLGMDDNFPANACTGQMSCDGMGQCKSDIGSPCANNGNCLNGLCVDGVCCSTACNGACKACNLPGTLGICMNIPSGQDPSNECAGAKACDGNGACQP